MRIVQTLLLSIAIAAAGCSRAAPAPIAPAAQAAPAVSSYRPGLAVTTEADAVAAVLQIRTSPDFKWTEAPRTLLVQEMSYEEAMGKVGLGQPDDAQFAVIPRDTRVWFVILFGKWTLKPMGPQGAAPIPYEGCLLTVVAAKDGSVIAAGDSICPGKG